jgi:hypothetical protein
VRAAVFSFVKMSESSMVASVRIAREVAAKLNLPIYDNAEVAIEPLDVLVIVNGAFAFCSCREALGQAVRDARRIVWIQNDYTIIIPGHVGTAETPFRKAFRDRFDAGKPRPDMWTTCEKESKMTPGSMRINWNALTLADVPEKVLRERRASAREYLLYYGSYREGRGDAFDRFFKNPTVDVVISSPSTKFAAQYKQRVNSAGAAVPPIVTHEKKFEGDLYARIGQAGLGLCCEDRRSHKENHSPPNRFYEMLSAGLPMVFQPEMAPSLRRSGFDPEPYVARYPGELPKMMRLREEIGAAQRERWMPAARAQHDAVAYDLRTAWRRLVEGL